MQLWKYTICIWAFSSFIYLEFLYWLYPQYLSISLGNLLSGLLHLQDLHLQDLQKMFGAQHESRQTKQIQVSK